MALKIEGDREANRVTIDEKFFEESSGKITLRSTGIELRIMTSRPSRMVNIDLGANSSFHMHKNSCVAQLNVLLLEGSRGSIGENTFGIHTVDLLSHEHAEISIGSDCLLGGSFKCLASDMHSILDAETGRRINPPGDIIVADKVWIGADVTLLKGTRIESESVIGIRSTVMGKYPPNCLILGYPAKLVKSGISWDRGRLPFD